MLPTLRKLSYLIQETWRGLRRGGWMNWAAISTVTVLLFLFGMQLTVSWQLDRLLNQFGSQLEISIYLKPDTKVETITPLVAKQPDVMEVKLVSKEQAWASLVKELGFSDIKSVTQQLDGNPLVDELKVKAKTPQAVLPLAAKLVQLPGVDGVRYRSEAIDRLAQINQGLGWVSGGITTFLTMSAIAVISTTIRLIFIARSREVEIMQLVGATAAWIYTPFLVQGLTFGLLGASFALTLITLIRISLSNLLAKSPDFLQFITLGLQTDLQKSWLLPIILLSFGSIVGLLGSFFAIRKLENK
jgi:cell division transport system permease protein